MTTSAVPDIHRELLASLAPDATRAADVGDRYARIAWNTLIEPGDRVAGAAIAAHGATAALAHCRDGSLQVPGATAEEVAAGRARWAPRSGADALTRVLRTAAAARLRPVIPSDPEWPTALDDLGVFAPLVLWVRGDAGLLRTAAGGVAIVGARAATSYGEHVATELSADLAASGHAVVSGAAFGIDAAAHRAALAVEGVTIALLAGGAERSYPHAHSHLIDRIAQTGVVASEVAPGSAPTKWRFLQRNRVIAALSGATVVVEAGWRSGSLNTAHHAAALGRPLGAVPGPITSAASAGCHRLLREMDAACITSADEIRELLGSEPPGGTDSDEGGASRGCADRVDDRTRVLDALSTRSPRSAESVAERAGLSVAAAQSLLGILRLEARADVDERGWRRR